MTATPDRLQILQMASGYRSACVLGAAAELDIFSILSTRPLSAADLAKRLGTNPRATKMLLDAVAALGLLEKQEAVYSVPADLRPLLCDSTPRPSCRWCCTT